ncbi:MAG TPA: glycosyltransferase [Thermoanaerobaculia bacterium]|nr:glycosyltransferase [Thermoanaerobaculia bacterium]
MRLLHVVPTYLPAWRHGGPIRAVHGLARALAERGHEVTVFTTDVHGGGRLDVPLGRPVPLDSVEVWYFPTAPPQRLYRSPALGAALARRAGAVDLLHLHSVFLWPTRVAARAAARAGVPYVLSPRGMLVPDLIRRRGRLRKLAWIHLVERPTLAGAAALHVTSALEGDEARRLGLPLPPLAVVPNGVEPHGEGDLAEDAGEPPAAVRDLLAGPPFVLFLGRVSWKKGLDRLVAALPHAPGAVLAIAGNDEEGYRPALARLAAAQGVAERVIFTGPVHGASKRALLAAARALALPSASENFGNAVLEAMAAGCPVIVTPQVGLAEVVRETGSGIVADGSPEALGGALRRLLEDAAAARAMGRRGAAAAARRFAWPAVAAAMEGVYAEALGGGARRRAAGAGA